MKKTWIPIAGFIAAMTVHGDARAADLLEYKIDPTHSSVIFKIKHRQLNNTYGSFANITGTLSVDNRKNPSTLSLHATVKAKSPNTNDKKRDRHLRSNDFFNVAKYAVITFHTTKAEKLDDHKFALTGDLTLLGKTKSITVTFKMTGETSRKGKHHIGGESTFTIKRIDFGLAPQMKGLGDEVTVTVSIQTKQVTPQSP